MKPLKDCELVYKTETPYGVQNVKAYYFSDVKKRILHFEDFLNADLSLCRKETNEDLIEYIEKLQKLYIETFGNFEK